MMTCAYPQFYLNDAQQNLGTMFDYAVRILHYDADRFFLYFIQSDAAAKFEHANPKYIAGMSGIELCENVLAKIGEKKTEQSICSDVLAEQPDLYMAQNKDVLTNQGVEFWLGWAMAYYQWYSGLQFSDLQEYGLVPSEILSRFILHEADISKFVNVASKIILKNRSSSPTRLQKLRKAHGLTQSELADLSGVSLRMIQLYEQRQNDINKASAETITTLARVLCCNFYEIMEIELEE